MTDDLALIRAQRARSNNAIATGDLDGVVAVMMSDVIVAVAGGPWLTGKAASRAAFALQMKDPAFAGYVRDTEHVSVLAAHNTATERGRWTARWRQKSGDFVMRGTYTAEWRRTDGGWLIQSETFVESPK